MNLSGRLPSAQIDGQREQKLNTRFLRLDRWEGLVLYLPALILVLVFKGYPLVRGFYLSFTRPVGVLGEKFAGLENYRHMFTDKIFLQTLVNASKSLAVLPIFIILPLVLAFLLHQRVPGWGFFRASYLFSYLMAPVMVGLMFQFMLRIDGPINTFLKLIGLDIIAIPWLGNTSTALWTVFAVILWTWFGLGTLIYLAGMATINEDLFEAARLDGANNFHVLFHIIVPHILPTIGYWSVIMTTGLLIWLFPFIYALTEGGLGYATMMPEYYIYLTATQFVDPGYSSALGIILFIFILVLSIFQVRMMYMQELE